MLPNPPRTLRSSLPKDLAVAMAHFNPMGYARPRENLVRAVRQFWSTVPVFVIELCYDGALPRCTPQLLGTRSVGVHIMHAQAQSLMFHKENLWQVLAERIPASYRKLVFLDADVLVGSAPVWLSRCAEALDTLHIIQPLSSIHFQEHPEGPKDLAPSTSWQPLLVAAASVRETPFAPDMAYPSPGYGLGVQRDWLARVGGLVTTSVVGAGDLMMLGSLCALDHMQHSQAYQLSPFAHADVQRFLDKAKASSTRVGFVAHQGLHLYHGSRATRQYASRHEAMVALKREDLVLNASKIWEFRDSSWNMIMRDYFAQRREDD